MDTSKAVVIGMDPHERSATVELMDCDERVLDGGRFGTDPAGFEAMLALGRRWPDRVWAVEGCEGIGKHLAIRLLDAGEQVVDVPAKLSARMRVYATGQGRKTDATDAHSIALVGVRIGGLRRVVTDQQPTVLQLLVDRRRRIGADHTRMVAQLHALLLELLPGGAKKDLSAAQARKLLATVRPKDPAGKTRKRCAMELVVDLERVYQRKKAANKELIELVKATRTGLLDLHGIGPSGSARLLVEVGDITRFPTRGHVASWTGTAPVDASSGDNVRHRLSRGGHRQINTVLHIMATVQLRNATEGRAYYDRKVAAGKTPNEAMRCLKRRLSDIVYKTMLDDLVANKATGPGGHSGTTLQSSVTDLTPDIGSSEKPHHGPDTTSLDPPYSTCLDTEGSHERMLGTLLSSAMEGRSRPSWPDRSALSRTMPGVPGSAGGRGFVSSLVCPHFELQPGAAPRVLGESRWASCRFLAVGVGHDA